MLWKLLVFNFVGLFFEGAQAEVFYFLGHFGLHALDHEIRFSGIAFPANFAQFLLEDLYLFEAFVGIV